VFYRKSGHVGIRRFGRVDPGRPAKVRKHRLMNSYRLVLVAAEPTHAVSCRYSEYDFADMAAVISSLWVYAYIPPRHFVADISHKKKLDAQCF
jgi:hypothetical protein